MYDLQDINDRVTNNANKSRCYYNHVKNTLATKELF